jgi:hypothetical protein
MPESLSPETAQKLDDAARAISREHHVNPSACGELRARMESKLLGYLSGAEKLTEEDAFVLVKEHFGEPEEVKKMLENVHMEAVNIGLARRIGVLLAATLGIGVLLIAVSCFVHFISYLSFGTTRSQLWIPAYVYLVLNPIFLYIILKRWRNEEMNGHTWFHTVRPSILILLIGALFIVEMAVPIVYYIGFTDVMKTGPFDVVNLVIKNSIEVHQTGVITGPASSVIVTPPYHENIGEIIFDYFHFPRAGILIMDIFPLVALVSLFAQCMIWVWWCDGASRRFTARFTAVCMWIAYIVLSSIRPGIEFSYFYRTGQLKRYVVWDNYKYMMFQDSMLLAILFGGGILILYILAGIVLEKMKRTRNSEIA